MANLLSRTNVENSVRYLAVAVDDAITLSERTEIKEKALQARTESVGLTVMNQRHKSISKTESWNV
jgi:hypothetical protein